MKRLLFLLFLFYAGTAFGLHGIKSLGYSEDKTQRIFSEIQAVMDMKSTTLNFNDLGKPCLLERLLETVYIYFFPCMSWGGAVRNKKHKNCVISKINLSGNTLTRIPDWLSAFPDLKRADLSNNDFPEWVLKNYERTERGMHFRVTF